LVQEVRQTRRDLEKVSIELEDLKRNKYSRWLFHLYN
jgi:uncharacterized membrane protein YjjP (DUF1212 family)